MEAFPDLKELLALLNTKHVEYLIVGSYALGWYGAPRCTGDLDVYVRPTRENATRILGALAEFGFGDIGLTQEDFSSPGQTVQLGRPPGRVDLLTSISGVEWDQAEAHKCAGNYGGVPVNFIGPDEFVANKMACGRHKDLADVEALDRLRSKKTGLPRGKKKRS